MAFDQNLEADRIDGFNIFSAIVRVPLLVIGGILGNDEKSRFHDVENDSSDKQGRCDEDETENTSYLENSLDDNLRGFETECTQRRQPLNTSTLDHLSQGHATQTAKEVCSNNFGMKRTKKMSWSDESGLPLVYENYEVRR